MWSRPQLRGPRIMPAPAGRAGLYLWSRIALAGRIDLEKEEMIYREPGIDAVEVNECSQEEPRCDDQHGRYRDLKGNDSFTSPAVATAACSLRTLLEGGAYFGARRRPGRQNAEQNSGADGNGCGEGKHLPMEGDLHIGIIPRFGDKVGQCAPAKIA